MDALSDYGLAELQVLMRSRGIGLAHAAGVMRAMLKGESYLEIMGGSRHKELESLLAEIGQRQSRVMVRRGSGDGTVKLLVGFDRGGAAETVLMPSFRDDRAMGCVSSQIGCAMGCDFCASTKGGLERNLTAGEIVEQFLHLRRGGAGGERRLMTIVFMGMGEPMQNLENVIAAIRRIADPYLGGLGWRHVTVSTVGIVPGIEALAEADLGVHLALSLHAADDETREKIVPMNRRYPIGAIMEALRRYAEKSGRVPTIEWCMIGGVNDSDEQAVKLAELLDGFKAHVNLIPYNSIGTSLRGVLYRAPTKERMGNFISILRDCGVVAHFRHTRGDDVDAACGQLRRVVAAEA